MVYKEYFRNPYSIVVIFFLVFVAVLFTTVFHHELWHEELQGWLIARDANSLSELYHNLRYESHPISWYLILFLISRITLNPFAMQLITAFLACFTAVIFVVFAPFRLYKRLLFIFGYFPLYEYGVLSRNYLMGVLLLFLFCVLYRRRYFVWAALVLGLSMQTSIICLIVGIVLGIYLFLEQKIERLWLMSVLIISAVVAFIQVIPPSDYGITVDWILHFDVKRALMVLLMFWRGFVPVPHLQPDFWNSNILVPFFTSPIEVADYVRLGTALFLSVVIFVFCCTFFSHSRRLLFLFGTGTFSLLLFFYVFYYGALRHWGFLYIFFIVCVWLSKRPFSNRQQYFFTVILCIQMCSGLFASFVDYRYLFSSGKMAADYIKLNNLERGIVIGDLDTHAVSVAGYLHEKLYYPREQRWGSFAVLDRNRRVLPENNFVLSVRPYARDRFVTLVLNYPLLYPHCGISFNKGFQAAIGKDESYYIYTLSPNSVRFCGEL